MSFYYSFFPPMTKTVKEAFENERPALGLTVMLGILLILVVQVFIVQFLWNRVLTSVVPVKPLKSFVYTLGFLVLMAMLFP